MTAGMAGVIAARAKRNLIVTMAVAVSKSSITDRPILSLDDEGDICIDLPQLAGEVAKAGYTKPCIISTVEELEALQDGVILRCGGVTYEHHGGWFHGVDGSNVTAELISLPAVILWESDKEAVV